MGGPPPPHLQDLYDPRVLARIDRRGAARGADRLGTRGPAGADARRGPGGRGGAAPPPAEDESATEDGVATEDGAATEDEGVIDVAGGTDGAAEGEPGASWSAARRRLGIVGAVTAGALM